MTDKFYGQGIVESSDPSVNAPIFNAEEYSKYLNDIPPESNFEKVGEFMVAMEQEILLCPTFPSKKVQRFRVELIAEEFNELLKAIDDEDLIEVADALGDLLYVVYGAGHAFGLPMNEIFNEIHRSNMTKLGHDGRPVKRADGKVMKSTTYERPNLAQFVVATLNFGF